MLRFLIHRKILAKIHSQKFLDAFVSIKRQDITVRTFVPVPRLPFLVNTERPIPSQYIHFFLEQLSENKAVYVVFGTIGLHIYKFVLRLVYNNLTFRLISFLPNCVYRIVDDGDILIVTNTSLVSVSARQRRACRYYLLQDKRFLQSDLTVRRLRQKYMPELLQEHAQGYEERFIVPTADIYEHIERQGKEVFFTDAINTMTALYQRLPRRHVAITDYVNDCITRIRKATTSTWIMAEETEQLCDYCLGISHAGKMVLCTIHGDLKVDQFVPSNGDVYILDWEFARVCPPEIDFVTLATSFLGAPSFLRQFTTGTQYLTAYQRMKEHIECDCLLTSEQMLGLTLLENVAFFSDCFTSIGLVQRDFWRYIYPHVSRFMASRRSD